MVKFHAWPDAPNERGLVCVEGACIICDIVAVLDRLCEMSPASVPLLRAMAQAEHEAKHGH